MVRSPSSYYEISSLKKGPWSPEEDQRLVDHITRHGGGNWRVVPKLAGLNRCGKSCRLRWINYLRPDIKRGRFSEEEESIIINLHSIIGNKWSRIASHLPGRTDNEIKNFWNTHMRKKFHRIGIDHHTHKPRTDLSLLLNLSQMLLSSQFGNLRANNPWDIKLQPDATQPPKFQSFQNLSQLMNASTVTPNTENHYGVLGFDQDLNPFPYVATQATMNPAGSSHQAIGELEGQINSRSWLEGLDHDVSNKNSSLNLDNSFHNNIQQENQFPSLIHASSHETSSINKMEKKSIESNEHLATFEALEKFMDDETNDSYWKTLLDLTPSSSSAIS